MRRDSDEPTEGGGLSRRRVVTLAGATAVATGVGVTGTASAHSADEVVFCDCDAVCVENLVGNADVVIWNDEKEDTERKRLSGDGETKCHHLDSSGTRSASVRDSPQPESTDGDDTIDATRDRTIVAVEVGPEDACTVYCNPNECARADIETWGGDRCDETGDSGSDCGTEDGGGPVDFRQCGKLVGDATEEFAQFGDAVAIADGVAVAGAPFDQTEAGPASGAVYVFERVGGGWTQVQMLTASDGEADDLFGSAVSLDGDSLIVGATGRDNENGPNAGAAYVFERNGSWTEVARLLAPDGEAFDEFGTSVSVQDGRAPVGAPFDDTGAVYVFERDGGDWTQVQKLTASDGEPTDLFGWAVSLDGEVTLVGAPGDSNANGSFAGAAYVFERNGTWTEASKLLAPGPSDRFGHAVSVRDDRALVGEPFSDNENGPVAGAVYVFERDGTWTFDERLIAQDGEEGQWFGWAVSLYGDTALVGAPAEDHDQLAESGAAYLFARRDGGWSQTQRLVADDPSEFASFGDAVSMVADQLLVGAPFDDNERGESAGAAYPFCAIEEDDSTESSARGRTNQ